MITAALTAFAGLSLRTKLETAGVVVVIAAGGLWWLTRTPPPVPEVVTAAPAQRQDDGSLVAERTPDPKPAPPPHALPAGAREVRREQVTVAPAPAAAASGCPPVRVDLSLVRMPDNGQRVVASSPDGQVVSALDIPIEPALVPAPARPWAAGLSYDTRHAVGIWVDRDVGRLVVGGALSRLPDGKTEAQLRVGVRF